jgi:hypothetical protein
MTAKPADPFAVLGLPARPDLDDEQVRAAWRAIAVATHPDRPDGGDPARYAAVSAAYAVLRTAWGRSEAYADFIAAEPPLAGRVVTPAASVPPAARPRLGLWRAVVLVPARIRHGRPGRLLVRVAAAAVLGVLAWHTGAGTVPAAALVTGIAVWLVLTIRADLAPPPGR